MTSNNPIGNATNQPAPPVQPSKNPGYVNKFLADNLIGAGGISTATLPSVASVAPGQYAYDATQGPLFSNGNAFVPIGSSLVSTIKSAIAASLNTNGVTVQPLTNPPAWVGSTTYSKGVAVSNGGNIYIGLGGVSAATGGPTGTGSAQITDGTCLWYYWGPTFTSSAQAPVISNVAFASRYTGLYWATTLNSYGIGSTRINDSTNFLFYPGPGTDGAGANNSYQWNTGSYLGGVSFMTDAPSFQIVIPTNIGPSINLFVNGVPVTVGCAFVATGNQFCQLVFPDRRPRLITFECEVSLIASFYGVLMNDTVSHVWAPAPPIAFSLSLVGTSYLDGSANHPVTGSLSIGAQIARYLGVSNFWIDRLGAGTGYVSSGSNSPFGSATRLAALVATNPQVIVITGGGVNDITAPSITAVGASSVAAYNIEYAACLAYFTAVRAALPSAIIIVIGSESGSTGPSAAIFNMEAAVSAAVTAMNDQYILFIPQSSTKATSAWISGTGNTSAPNGTGNADNLISPDALHPVQLGVNELAFRSANSIRQVISALN